MQETVAQEDGGTTGWLERHATGAALVIALVLSFAGVFQQGLWAPDEPREAEIGREMYLAHGSALPTLGGRPFLDKPPLFVWTMAASYWLLGVTPGAARLPAVIFSLGSLFVAYRLGRRVGGPLVALLSLSVLATSNEFWWISHRAINDTALTTFVAGGHLLFLEARDRMRAGTPCWPWLGGFGLLGALAFLTKGAIGVALLGAPPLLGLLALGEWSAFRHALWSAAAAGNLFLAVLGLPWMLELAGHPGGWGNVYECVVRQVVARGLGRSAPFSVHAQRPWYYLYVFPLAMMPWSLAFPAIGLFGRRARKSASRRVEFLAWLVLAGIALLSIPAGKRDLYLMPLLPAASALVAVWLSRAHAARRADRATGIVLLTAVAGVTTTTLAVLVAARQGLLPRLPWLSQLLDALGPAAAVGGGVAVGALAASSAWAAWGVYRGHVRVLGGTVMLHVVLLAGLAHLIGRPFVDPLRNMQRGALELAGDVPPREPLVALQPDETMLAVVPFYTGRLVDAVRRDDVGDALRRGRMRYLLVTDAAEDKLADSLRCELDVVARVRLSNTRRTTIYRWTGSPSRVDHPSGSMADRSGTASARPTS